MLTLSLTRMSAAKIAALGLLGNQVAWYLMVREYSNALKHSQDQYLKLFRLSAYMLHILNEKGWDDLSEFDEIALNELGLTLKREDQDDESGVK
jgi:hypothetical protein